MVRKTPCQRGARSTKVERRQGKYGRQPALSHRRLRFFRCIGVWAGPILFLCLLEVSLRVAGYGYPLDATVGCVVDGVAHRGDNVKFGWRFFPRLVAREFEPFVFLPGNLREPIAYLYSVGPLRKAYRTMRLASVESCKFS